jgi:hypothetical protein
MSVIGFLARKYDANTVEHCTARALQLTQSGDKVGPSFILGVTMSTNTGEKLQFARRLQAHVAMRAITASALRNQGSPGVVDAAREYVAAIDLRETTGLSESQFRKWLNLHTGKLRRRFPVGARSNWGAARKALALFLRDAIYCLPLSEYYDLARIRPLLELPLDREAHSGLILDFPMVPVWPGVKALRWRTNAQMQRIAATIAQGRQIHRVDLDIGYWRKAAIKKLMS